MTEAILTISSSASLKQPKKTKTSASDVAQTMDDRYPGLSFSHDYFSDTQELRVQDDQGVRLYDEDGDYTHLDLTNERIEAESSVRYLHINTTGARPGDLIVGVHNIARDAILRIAGGVLPPSKRDLNMIRHFPDLWTIFLNKLATVEFFHTMTIPERMTWLFDHQRDGDYDLAEVPNVFVEIVDVGKSTFLTIEQEKMDILLSGNPERDDRAWPILYVRDQFPRKPGSKARRHTLIFYLHFWKLSNTYKHASVFAGPVYDMKKMTMTSGGKGNILVFGGLAKSYAQGKHGYEVESKQEFGVILDATPPRTIDYFDLLLSHFEEYTLEDIAAVREACRAFTPAGYKSLLQKIIRYAPVSVVINAKPVAADFVLAVVLTFLLTNPGSFVPDIQRFVSGQESTLKRLAVSILEDSWHPKGEDLLKLLVMSFLTQRMNKWRLNEEEYLWFITLSQTSLANSKIYVHGIEKGFEITPYILSATRTALENVSALLDEVKSFASDLAMTRFIAHNKGKAAADIVLTRPVSMEVYHCIDQHWAPEIVYFLPTAIIEKYRQPGTKPYSELFAKIFRNVTGENSRRPGRGLSHRRPDMSPQTITLIKKAQRYVLIAKQTKPAEMKVVSGKTYPIHSELDISWLSGLVGPISVKGKPPTMVTMRPEDPYQLIAIRQPSRGMKDGTLTDERTEEAIAQAKTRLEDVGVSLKTIAPPIPGLGAYKLYLSDGVYQFIKGKEIYDWKTVSTFDAKLPIHEKTMCNFENAMTLTGKGVQLDAKTRLVELMSKYSTATIRRFLTYISSHRSEIEIARISKDGGPTAAAVMPEDCGACQLIWYTTLLYPAAVSRVTGYASKFEVKLGPLLWQIRDNVAAYLQKSKPDAIPVEEDGELPTEWSDFEDTSGRVPRSYQTDAVDAMIEKNKKGKKGHFLWMTVGLGKTLCAFLYLRYLQQNGKLPPYVIYALPKSALRSIIVELEYFGLPINLLLPVATWKKHAEVAYVVKHDTLVPYHINIIEHDHMRRMEDELISKASSSVLVIDEVHKTLNESKRTGVALEVSRLSQDFIAMTGTPVVDSNLFKLIQWLEQVVEFEVTENNFWAAANGMISARINTGIDVDRREVVATFTAKERAAYNNLVPPGLGGSNVRPSAKEITEAFEVCYAAADRKVIEETMAFIADKKGVMVVVRNYKHQEKMKELLLKAGLKEKDMYLLKGGESLFMADEAVKNKTVPDYKAVLIPLQLSMGYTLTRLKAMVTGVFPSSQATREQLDGRINRITQKAKIIHYRIVHVGILTHVLRKHNDAASISSVLSALAKEIEMQ